MATAGSAPFKPASGPPHLTEDWLAVCIGMLLFVLSLGLLFGADLLGWSVTTNVWTTPGKALAPASKNYAHLPVLVSLVATYLFMMVILLVGVKALKANLKRFVLGFTAVFFVSYACWFVGSWAYIAATPNMRTKFQIPWSLNLTNESGFVIALLAGLFVGNFLPESETR